MRSLLVILLLLLLALQLKMWFGEGGYRDVKRLAVRVEEQAGEVWAASFMNAIKEQDVQNEMFANAGLDPHPLKGFKFNTLSKWGRVSKYSSVPDWLDSWSEHCTLFSLDAYFPIAQGYAKEVLHT